MVAILGADETSVNELCEQCAQGEILGPANFNSPGQIVVSGAIGACGRVAQAAEAKGFKAIPLKVAGAFHSPLMQSAADRMKAELEKVAMNPPRATVYANVTASPHADARSIRELLVQQVIRPVRWEQTMRQLVSKAELRFVERAPGRTLAVIIKKINRRTPVECLEQS
jgi:[acyl-carrier-protein] S-malonyltransferase